MLRLIHVGNTLPVSYAVDPTSTFQAGQIGQLKVLGNEVVAGVSDGTAPFGIIDDVNTAAFTRPVVDEVVVVPVTAVSDGYRLITAVDTMATLQFANIVRSSFTADIEGLVLNEVNGVITVTAGTPLNYDSDNDGILDSVRTVVNYVYRIANLPGENTTIGSGRITLWIQRGIFETDQFDTHQRYVVNATLFVNGDGLLTTSQPSPNHPGVALVTGPPTGLNETLEFLWL